MGEGVHPQAVGLSHRRQANAVLRRFQWKRSAGGDPSLRRKEADRRPPKGLVADWRCRGGLGRDFVAGSPGGLLHLTPEGAGEWEDTFGQLPGEMEVSEGGVSKPVRLRQLVD